MKNLDPTLVVDIDNEAKINEAEELTETIQIEGTPLDIIKIDDKYFVALGKWRLTDMLDTKEECLAIVDRKDWTLLMTVIHAVTQEVYRQNKLIEDGEKRKDSYNESNKKAEGQ